MSDWLPSSTRIHWWFRSRSSGRLNSLSYWLLALIAASVVYALLTLITTTGVAYYHRLGESDWLESRLPNSLTANGVRSTFIGQLRPLVDKVQYGDQGQNADNSPLFEAKKVQRSELHCDPAGALFNGRSDRAASMFDKGEIQVFPTCVTFAPGPSGQLSPAEREVFQNFAVYATSSFRDFKGSADEITHTERRLARVVGLGDAVNVAPFDVPWLYVASEDGAIAVFPGTTVIAEDRWQTNSRPWFMAAFKGETELAYNGVRDSDLLTATYLDILAKTPTLVRTYLCKFSITKPQPQQFVIGIDLHRRALESMDGLRSTVSSAPWLHTWRVMLALALSALFFAMVRWASTVSNRNFVFRRMDGSIYGMVDVKDTTSFGTDNRRTSSRKFELSGGKHAEVTFEESKEQNQSLRVENFAEKSRIMRRGIEHWIVSQDIRTTWHLFRLRFESVAKTRVGQIELTYTSAILPDAHWHDIDEQAFSDSDTKRNEARLPFVLQRNADCCDGKSFEVPQSSIDGAVSLHASGIPETVRTVVNSQELLAVRQRRAYVTLDGARLDELYSKSDVKAVIQLSYFERLLRHGQIDFLLRGKTIHRLVSFPDQATDIDLTGNARDTYNNLLASYSPVSSRLVRRVNASIDVEGTEPQPVYDFALLNDQLLIVSHYVSESSVIDVASGKEAKPQYRVDGYVSWRKSDLEFYRELFEKLARESTPIVQRKPESESAGENLPLSDATRALHRVVLEP
jgi:hypothetical protein